MEKGRGRIPVQGKPERARRREGSFALDLKSLVSLVFVFRNDYFVYIIADYLSAKNMKAPQTSNLIIADC
ncbi:MAG: hypothetical protein EBE86_016575 [Hormoscilla sp. GUM202]|nr:hypothetical protein [Hormoscilla sp. GUM202]